jgi:hypothetical protein
MSGDHWYLREESPCDVLRKFIEIFQGKGWLNSKLRIKYQNNRYWISCNEERFFAYEINDNCGIGPGVPGWPVCLVEKNYVYDEAEISAFTPTKFNTEDWLNIIANQKFELL